MCKIWYSISRTISDPVCIRGNVNDCSIRAFAVQPRAFGAPQSGFWGLTAQRGGARERRVYLMLEVTVLEEHKEKRPRAPGAGRVNVPGAFGCLGSFA